MTSAQWNKTRALQVEYLHKYPTRKKPRPTKYSRPAGRIRSLIEICSRINEPIQLHIDDLFLTTARSDLLAFSHVQVLPLHVSDIIISAPTVVDLTIDLTNE